MRPTLNYKVTNSGEECVCEMWYIHVSLTHNCLSLHKQVLAPDVPSSMWCAEMRTSTRPSCASSSTSPITSSSGCRTLKATFRARTRSRSKNNGFVLSVYYTCITSVYSIRKYDLLSDLRETPCYTTAPSPESLTSDSQV